MLQAQAAAGAQRGPPPAARGKQQASIAAYLSPRKAGGFQDDWRGAGAPQQQPIRHYLEAGHSAVKQLPAPVNPPLLWPEQWPARCAASSSPGSGAQIRDAQATRV